MLKKLRNGTLGLATMCSLRWKAAKEASPRPRPHKTGTRTRNEMTACRVVGPWHTLMVDGEGDAPHGRLRASGDSDDADALADATALLRCALLCNDATLQELGGTWTVVGDPMEGALLALAGKAGLDPDHERGEWLRVDEIPFDAVHRFMATLHRNAAQESVVFVKGAPEQLLEMAQPMSGAVRARWAAALAEAASSGERVLGFGAKRPPAGHDHLHLDDVARGVEMLGLVGFIDPPRQEPSARLRSAGRPGSLSR
jgi:magnesium-transporting ATPase (P-type)